MGDACAAVRFYCAPGAGRRRVAAAGGPCFLAHPRPYRLAQRARSSQLPLLLMLCARWLLPCGGGRWRLTATRATAAGVDEQCAASAAAVRGRMRVVGGLMRVD